MTKLLLTLMSIIILSACSLNVNINQDTTPTPAVPTEEQTESQTPTQISTPTTSSLSIEEQLTTFFANKFSKPIADAILTVSQNTGTHASGGIKFQGEIAGGMWLAHNDNGTWMVDYDGNGTIPCQDVEPYNYPATILSECWDETNQSIKNLNN